MLFFFILQVNDIVHLIFFSAPKTFILSESVSTFTTGKYYTLIFLSMLKIILF